MKTMKMMAATLLLTLGMMACEKDKSDAPNKPEGTYVGKWGDVNGPVHSFFKIELQGNGKLVRFNESGTATAEGIWTLNGINFEGNYTHFNNGEKHSVAGIYTDFNGEIMGTWGYGNSKANGGTFELKKQ